MRGYHVERLKQILIKEFIQIFRDPRARGIVFVMPIFQMVIFGYAVTTDVKQVATGIYDLDHSVASREVVARFVHSGYFEIEASHKPGGTGPGVSGPRQGSGRDPSE